MKIFYKCRRCAEEFEGERDTHPDSLPYFRAATRGENIEMSEDFYGFPTLVSLATDAHQCRGTKELSIGDVSYAILADGTLAGSGEPVVVDIGERK